MTAVYPALRNLNWRGLRQDTARFPTVCDCAHHCLPSLRACAGLFFGNQCAGDMLVESFLIDAFAGTGGHGCLHTPAGMAAAFEDCLRREFGAKPQRIVLTHAPSQATGVWMSVDEFLTALVRD